jgi:hypothetical protein
MSKSNFDGLMDEVEDTLKKAIPVDDEGNPEDSDAVEGLDDPKDDERIAAAADEGGAGDEAGEGLRDREDEDEEEDEEEDDVLGKSLRFTLKGGEEVEAFDGTQVVKSLMTRVERQEDSLSKSLDRMGGLLKKAVDTVGRQEKMLKSMGERLDKVSNEGRGRRTVVSIHDKPSTNGEGDAGNTTSPDEFLAKSIRLEEAGKVPAGMSARAEAYINSGVAPPEEVVRAVAEAS